MDRIHVTVRARPLSPDDAKTCPWRISGNSIFIPNHSSKFEFEQILGETARLERFVNFGRKTLSLPMFVDSMAAYGQTNGGKTHTMRGSTAEPGVIDFPIVEISN